MSVMASNKMDRFTPEVQHDLGLAQAEAEWLQYRYFEPEHLLFGLMQGTYKAAYLVRRAGFELALIESMLRQMLPVEQRRENESLGLSKDTKKIVELAAYTAKLEGRHQIGIDDLILGFTSEDSNIFVRLVERLNLNTDTVRHQMLRMMGKK